MQRLLLKRGRRTVRFGVAPPLARPGSRLVGCFLAFAVSVVALPAVLFVVLWVGIRQNGRIEDVPFAAVPRKTYIDVPLPEDFRIDVCRHRNQFIHGHYLVIGTCPYRSVEPYLKRLETDREFHRRGDGGFDGQVREAIHFVVYLNLLERDPPPTASDVVAVAYLLGGNDRGTNSFGYAIVQAGPGSDEATVYVAIVRD